jgi:hypothetical protein
MDRCSPGTCPSGTTRVDITTQSQLASAARGESSYDKDPPATCYFIHNGTYSTTGVVLYVLKGDIAGGAPRAFVGESRAGVVIHGRGNLEDGVSDVLVTNLTFDLAGYVQAGAFNALNLGNGGNITIDHIIAEQTTVRRPGATARPPCSAPRSDGSIGRARAAYGRFRGERSRTRRT